MSRGSQRTRWVVVIFRTVEDVWWCNHTHLTFDAATKCARRQRRENARSAVAVRVAVSA